MKTLALIVALGLGAVGCSGEDTAAPREGVQTSIDMPAKTVALGETFELTVGVMNYGPDLAQITFSTGCTFGYRLVSSDAKVFTVTMFCPGIGSKLTLHKDEGRKKTFMVPTVEPRGSDWPIDGDQLPLGVYTVHAGLLDNEIVYPWARASIEVVP